MSKSSGRIEGCRWTFEEEYRVTTKGEGILHQPDDEDLVMMMMMRGGGEIVKG